MKHKIYGILLLLLIPFLSLQAEKLEDNTYPTAARLFHIARSANRNLVCYDVNLQNGKVDHKRPISVYWINREEHPGKRDGLNYIQRKLAYGYKVVESGQDNWKCTLTAYPKRQLVLTKLKNHYVCLITINHQRAILESLYVKANPRNPLKVEYVELHGKSMVTNKPVIERINNK